MSTFVYHLFDWGSEKVYKCKEWIKKNPSTALFSVAAVASGALLYYRSKQDVDNPKRTQYDPSELSFTEMSPL